MRMRYHGEQIANRNVSILAERRGISKPTVGFMLGDLTDDPNHRLPESPQTITALRALGAAMAEDPSSKESNIPAAYTYFGQFIDHDITNTAFDPSIRPPGEPDPIESNSISPITRNRIPSLVSNRRSAALDLDSVYGGPAQETIEPDGRFRLGEVSVSNFRPIETSDKFHDLPRRPMITNPTTEAEEEADRQAIIGDPRNDENLLVAQLHLGILRSHNAFIGRGMSFSEARRAVRRRYQWAVLHDFLPRVCDNNVVQDILQNGPKVWRVEDPIELFMPIEFSAAAYRFGHSMIRGEYSHNSTFNPEPGNVNATFNFFFTFTALSGDLQPGNGPNFEFATLPDNWPIEWHRFFGTNANPASMNPARRIDANLTPELGLLRDFQGLPIQTLMGKLAARNLLRGYLVGLPTGQAAAGKWGIPELPAKVLRNATPAGLSKTIEDAGLFQRTPLWFYILAEAGDPDGPDGNHLGALGSRIVGETLWNLTMNTADNVLTSPPTASELQSGEFTLAGLIKIGQDSAMPEIEI